MESSPLPTWQSYASHAAHSSLERGRESGQVTITDRGFRFRGERGEFFVPLKGAQLTLGGASDRLIFISHPIEPGLSIYTADLGILRDNVLQAHPELTAALRVMKRRRARNWTLLAAAVLVVVGLPLSLVFNIDFLAGIAVKQVPYSWEESLGKSALAQVKVQGDFIPDEEVGALLKTLTAPLVDAVGKSPYTFHFYVTNDKSINAFALPGGYIVIHSELLLRAESADELLGVLAHEIAHVTERHGTRGVIAKAGVWLLFQAAIGDAGGVLTAMAGAAPFLLSQQYSRRFETDADEQGYKLLDGAHVDAQGMVRFFGRIRDEEAAQLKKAREQLGEESDVLTDLPEFLRTHPLTDKRIAHIEGLAKHQRGPFVDLNGSFNELREKVREFAARKQSTPAPETESTP